MNIKALKIRSRNWIYSRLVDTWLSWGRAALLLRRKGYLQWPHDFNVVLSPSTTCNARCIFCGYTKTFRKKAYVHSVMTNEMAFNVIDQLVGARAKTIGFSAMAGEVLVDPNAIDKIEYACCKGPIVSLTTNGILLYKHVEELFKCGLNRLDVSMPGMNAQTYVDVYGVDRYAEVIHGVHRAMRINAEMGHPMQIGIAFRNAEPVASILESHDFRSLIKPLLSRRNTIAFMHEFHNWGDIIRPSDLKGAMKAKRKVHRFNLPCEGVRSFIVLPSGNVRLCGCGYSSHPEDDMIVGNVKIHSLQEMASNASYRHLVDSFRLNRRPKVCETCTLYTPLKRKYECII